MSYQSIKLIFVIILVLSLSATGYSIRNEVTIKPQVVLKDYNLQTGESFNVNGYHLILNVSAPLYPDTVNLYRLDQFNLNESNARAVIESKYPNRLTKDYTMQILPTYIRFYKSDQMQPSDELRVYGNGAFLFWEDVNLIPTLSTGALPKVNLSSILSIAIPYLESHGVDTKDLVVSSIQGAQHRSLSCCYMLGFHQIIFGRESDAGASIYIYSNGFVSYFSDYHVKIDKYSGKAIIKSPGLAFGKINNDHNDICNNNFMVENISLVYYINFDDADHPSLHLAWIFGLCNEGCNINAAFDCNEYYEYGYSFDAETLGYASYF